MKKIFLIFSLGIAVHQSIAQDNKNLFNANKLAYVIYTDPTTFLRDPYINLGLQVYNNSNKLCYFIQPGIITNWSSLSESSNNFIGSNEVFYNIKNIGTNTHVGLRKVTEKNLYFGTNLRYKYLQNNFDFWGANDLNTFQTLQTKKLVKEKFTALLEFGFIEKSKHDNFLIDVGIGFGLTTKTYRVDKEKVTHLEYITEPFLGPPSELDAGVYPVMSLNLRIGYKVN